MKIWKNDQKQDMTYDEVCEELGFTSSVHFVEITTAGTIGFSVGKPNEILALFRAVKDNGYRPSKALVKSVETL